MHVKVCGCRTPADALAAVEAGATHIGLVFAESPRRVTQETAAEIVAAVSGRAQPVAVFVDERPDAVLAAARASGIWVAQLHGSESPEACAALRAAGLEVWKAVRPRRAEELEEALERYGGVVDALLVEGFSAKAAGGTGTSFPHAWLAKHRDRFRGKRPRLVLAGGLTPENVAAAIRTVRPTFVDVSSGVERAPGKKDPVRIQRFIEAATAVDDPSAA